MPDVTISQRYLKAIVAGLLLCGLAGFALGQALGHQSTARQLHTTIARAAGALGTAVPSSSAARVTTKPPTTPQTAPSVVYVPAAYAPGAPHPYHKAKHGHGDAQHDSHNGAHGSQGSQGSGYGGQGGRSGQGRGGSQAGDD